jgi:DNA (cytosine-5)-methyltransferase 1
MKHASLFSGIGGFDLAAEWAGWDNIFHCEWNPFGQKVLKYHFPKSISYNDITKTDFNIYRGRIDVLTGGFPCQPYSTAGLRKGKEDDRHLWPEMLRAIREIQPRWVVGENVRGLVNWGGGMVFEEVQADLEKQGYEVQPFIIPAAGVNAPHRRERIWFIAYAYNKGRSPRLSKVQSKNGKVPKWDNNAKFSNSNDRVITNPNGFGRNKNDRINNGESNEFNKNGKTGDITNSFGVRLEYCAETRQVQKETRNAEGERDKSSLSFKTNGNGYKSKWENFPTKSAICGGNDGLSGELDGITFSKWRKESIKAYGNAIVPQVAFEIFKTINTFESIENNI